MTLSAKVFGSISAKIILWSVAALILSFAVFFLVAQNVIGNAMMERFEQYNILHFEQARAAYETGGPVELTRFLSRVCLPDLEQCYLTDAAGKDLATGEDRREMTQGIARRSQAAVKRKGKMILGTASGDGRYVWVLVVTPPSAARLAPFYLLVLAVVGVLYWLAAANIASPLRRLAAVVDRIGRGDLAARAETSSKDEVGNLGRSVNAMAERIQTLLMAERQLLQDVSHELRSPLARLTFEAELVRKTSDRDAAAARLRHEIDRLSELVGGLIEMARAEGDPGSVDMEIVCISELLQSVAGDCAVEAAARGCTISAAPLEAVDILGNGELLRRAIENIVRNAIRYSPAGATVEAGLRRDGQHLVISVRDHGPGIPEDLIPRIFDPFFRVDPSRTEGTGGPGLGLAIARRAIRVHHGDITAENARPGARFRITIPIDSLHSARRSSS
jgi:two-component system sensor histidine kinase CpxA